jgi:hypothetical protein
MRVLRVMLCMVMIGGCSVQSSQLSTIMDFINTSSKDIPLDGWFVKYAGYEAIVYPVSLPQGILFSNQAGDEIMFDGWSVRRVRGMGISGPAYHSSDIGNKRTIKRGSRSLAVHNCNIWQQRQQSGKKQFIQYCKGDKVYSNSILVDKEGSIDVIRQVVDERGSSLTLTRLN